MTHQVITGTLTSAVADSATFTADYPSGTNEGSFYLAMGHKLAIGQSVYSFPDDFDVTLGASNVTITNKSGTSWPDDSVYRLQLEEPGQRAYRDPNGNLVKRATIASVMQINLGAPDAAVANGVVASQAITAADGLATGINGSLASGGVATFDVPRNVVAAWTGAAVMTVTGTDEYGRTIVESSASGTSLAGKKAFKTVTDVSVSADVTAATVGSGDVLGLPVFLPAGVNVLKELQDGAAATAGTLVAGIRTAGGSTATTGDVRGTYDPSAACDGDKVFQLVVALPDPGYLGIPQFAG